MTPETAINEQETWKPQASYRAGASEAVYGMGLIGAWFYYLTHAATFWMGIVGILKGIFWPAFLVYEALKYLGM